MFTSVLGQVIVILLLIIANGVFAMSEIAMISARKVRLQQQANSGNKGASIALELHATPNRFLSTIQIGITLIGVFAGALGGAKLAAPVASLLAQVGFLAPYSESIALVIVVLTITYLSLVIGELVPKRLALNNPDRIATAVAAPMRAFGVITDPAIKLLGFSTDLTLRLLGVQPSSEPAITEEEIEAFLEQGTEAGALEEIEEDMVKRVLLLDDRRASALMTPRRDVVWLDLHDATAEIRQKIIDSPFSRFPVAEGSLDNVVGEVRAKDVLTHSLPDFSFNIQECLRKPLYIAEVMPALDVLSAFKQSNTEMAFVIDEYGSIQGVITVDDIFGAIVGDVPCPNVAPPRVAQREDETWLVDGMLPVDEFKETFDIDMLPGEDQGFYQTVAGFMMMQLGRVPAEADHFEWDGYTFEVMDMDGPRVDKVLLSPREVDAEADSELGEIDLTVKETHTRNRAC
jgi:putative hemolysin